MPIYEEPDYEPYFTGEDRWGTGVPIAEDYVPYFTGDRFEDGESESDSNVSNSDDEESDSSDEFLA